MEAIVQALPLIIAAIVPPLFAAVRTYITAVVPDKFIPLLLPIGGGVLAGIAAMLGIDASVLATVSTDPGAWETVTQGVLIGSASVGLHQAAKQIKKTE